MQELSIVCEVHPPSLSRIVPKLVELELIQRDTDPSDQRRILTRLTSSGRELIAKVSEGSAEIYRSLSDAVGVTELENLQERLSDLITKIDRARLARERCLAEMSGLKKPISVRSPSRR